MNDILTEGRNALQRILSLSAEVHQNMFLVQDAGFVTVALAWKGSFGAGKPWDSSALKASIGRSMSPDAPDFYCSSSTGAVLIEQLACAFRWLAEDVRHRCAWGQIDHNGSALFCYEAKRPDVVWDYRGYDIQLNSLILKGEIEEIAEGYSAFEAYL